MATQFRARIRLLTLLAGFFTPLLLADAVDYEGKRIAEIQFDPAEQPLSRKVLDEILPVKANQILRLADVRAAIQKLFATGRYADVAVDALLSDGQVVLQFLTRPNFFVGRVSVSGVPEPPNKGQLAGATKLQLGTQYNDADVKQALENLQLLLQKNGFYKPTIQHTTKTDTRTEQIDIDFAIDPKNRAKFEPPIVTGNAERSLASIIRGTKWQRLYGILGWRQLTENRVQQGLEGVRNLYQKRDYLLAKVNLQKLDFHEAGNTVQPTLNVAAGPAVKVQTQGAKLRKGKLKELVPIYQERTVDTDLLIEGKRNLTEYFQSQGFFDVKVDLNQEPETGKDALIEYTIERNGRHKLVLLEIKGNTFFTAQTLRERMYLAPANLLRFRHGRYSRHFLDQDLNSIRELYRSNGFREVKVTSRSVDDYQKTAQIAVFIDIVEGPQWFVSNLEMEGLSDEDKDYLRSILRSSEGQSFSETNVASDRDSVLNFYYNNGYPDATFNWDSVAADEEHKVRLRFKIHPGDRKYVREVLVSGLERTRPELVYDRISFRAGDPLSQTQTTESQRRLYDLGIFAKVDTAIQNPEGEEREKYVLYQVEEARKYSFNFGFGAEIARIGGCTSCFDSPAGTTGVSPRVSLGVSRLNFLGLGHTLALQTRISTLQRRGVVTYFAPQFQGNENLNLTFTGLYDDSRDVRTFSAKRYEGSVQLGQKLTRANTVQYRFTYRQVHLGTVNITPALVPILAQSVRVGALSTTFIQDRRDDPSDSHRGMYNTIDVGYASRFFGSQTEFGRVVARNATYHRLRKDLVLARTLYFGQIQRIGGTPDIPLPERFFSGGTNSHRGFPDNQAGPRDAVTGFPLGGKALVINGLELRFPLIAENIGGVVFHDAGNVYTGLKDVSFRYRQRDRQDFNYMVHAVGFGIRYRTPVGPVRVDIAYSPNSPRFNGFQGTREELLCGTKLLSNGSCDFSMPLPPVPQRINPIQFHFSLGQSF